MFSEETEKELTECISVVCNTGFSPTMHEITVSKTVVLFYYYYAKNWNTRVFPIFVNCDSSCTVLFIISKGIGWGIHKSQRVEDPSI